MTIDTANRRRVADAIQGYLDGALDNFRLDDELMQIVTEDVACHEIAKEMWYFFDDVKRHYNAKPYEIDERAEAIVRRWISFLRSDLKWKWPPFHASDVSKRISPMSSVQALTTNEFWPFESEQAWQTLLGNSAT